MDYFRLLNLTSEPFSNSPDPDFFFQSEIHQACLQKLELALRLKRGLNVVIGEIGTGKTTLCRQLLRRLPQQESFSTHLILDPAFDSVTDLLRSLVESMIGTRPAPASTEGELREIIKDHLFSEGVEKNKIIVLVIDEGQKLPPACIEQLRELLNYETNDFKLLQIVIFAQPEFRQIISRHPNFGDRINLFYLLGPLDFKNTKQMIDYRLRRSGCPGGWRSLFTPQAIRAVYRITGGYPRKLINLCHHCILGLIVKDAGKVNRSLVLATARRNLMPIPLGVKAAPYLATAAVMTAVVAIFFTLLPNPWTEGHRLAKVLVTVPRPGLSRKPEVNQDMAADVVQTGSNNGAALNRAEQQDRFRQNAMESEAPVRHPPSDIGKIKIRPNDTLADLIKEVYGRFNPGLLKLLLAGNPDIRDPDTIWIGQQVVFPAVVARKDQPALDLCWIKIADAPTLSTAVEMLGRLKRLNSIPLQLVISWNPGKGLAYEIMVRGYFESTSAADSTINQLVTFPGQEPGCISGWPRETVFFSDPYQAPFRFPEGHQQQSG